MSKEYDARSRHLNGFLSDILEQGKSYKTYSGYRHDIDLFLAYCDKIQISSLQSVTQKHADTFFYTLLMSESRAPNTVKRIFWSVRLFFRYLVTQGVIEEHLNPVTKMPGWLNGELPDLGNTIPSIPRQRLSTEQAELIIDLLPDTTPAHQCYKTILCLIIETGIKAHEITKLTLFDESHRPDRTITPEGIVYYHGAGKLVWQRMPAKSWELFREWIANGRPACKDKDTTDLIFITDTGEAITTEKLRRFVADWGQKNGYNKLNIRSFYSEDLYSNKSDFSDASSRNTKARTAGSSGMIERIRNKLPALGE